jgi:tetratricopeptide (TPR) repeat protein
MATQSRHDEVLDLLTRGRNLRGCGYPVRALPYFLRAVHLAPDNKEANAELKVTRDKIHGLFDVVSNSEEVLAGHSTDSQVLLALANAFTRLDRDEEAEAALESALDLDRTDWEALFHLGHLLNNCGRYEEALAVFDRLIAVDTDWSHPWACKGMVLCNMHRYAEALPILDQALAIDPNDIGGWTEKVRALYALGRDEEARAAHKRENAARRASGVPKWMPRDEE